FIHGRTTIDPPFPYTTLFRSTFVKLQPRLQTIYFCSFLIAMPCQRIDAKRIGTRLPSPRREACCESVRARCRCKWSTPRPAGSRSEEPTSELQSRANLVCRLL